MRQEVVIDAISNGLGSQSMFLMLLAARGIIPARVSITADTGAELDCVWNTGRRSTAKEYFDEVVLPFAGRTGIEALFVRACDKHKNPLPSLHEYTRMMIAKGKITSLKIPVFGSEGGRMGQSCTHRWKVVAIRQAARRMGATKLITAQGIHFAEAGRRAKGKVIGKHEGWTLYQETQIKRVLVESLPGIFVKVKEEIPVKWCQHYYPMVDLKMGRKDAQQALEAEGLPYLVSSQCDDCPHNDYDRWMRHKPEVLVQIAEVEASMGGKFFFTDERVPLMEALKIKSMKPKNTLEPTFGCEGSYCGV